MFNMGPMEIAAILIVALLVVGPKRLPEIGKTIGRSLRDFKRVQEDLRSSIDLGLDDDPARPNFDRAPDTDAAMARERRHRRRHEDEHEASDGDEGAAGSPDDPHEASDATTDGATPAG